MTPASAPSHADTDTDTDAGPLSVGAASDLVLAALRGAGRGGLSRRDLERLTRVPYKDLADVLDDLRLRGLAKHNGIATRGSRWRAL